MKEKSAMSRKWKEKKDRGMRLKLVERTHFMCDKKRWMNTKTGKLRKNLFHYFKGKKFRILSQGRTDKKWRVTKKKNENQGNMEDWKSRENKKRWRNRE